MRIKSDAVEPWRIAWARNLRAARKALGWTQPATAERTPGVSAKQISYYEMTGRIPIEHLIPLARSLDIPVEELFPLPDVLNDVAHANGDEAA